MRTRETNKGRRRLLAGIATVGLTLGGSAAYAFWTGGENAGGTAIVGSQGGGFVQVSQVGVPTGLAPGGPAKQVKILVTNPNADESSSVFLYGVHIEVDPAMIPIDHDGDPATPACTAADFTTQDALYGGFVSGTQSLTLTTGTITMIDRGPSNPEIADPATDPNNQDACKGASIDLSLTPMYSAPPPPPPGP